MPAAGQASPTGQQRDIGESGDGAAARPSAQTTPESMMPTLMPDPVIPSRLTVRAPVVRPVRHASAEVATGACVRAGFTTIHQRRLVPCIRTTCAGGEHRRSRPIGGELTSGPARPVQCVVCPRL